jgi:hypothetical protein
MQRYHVNCVVHRHWKRRHRTVNGTQLPDVFPKPRCEDQRNMMARPVRKFYSAWSTASTVTSTTVPRFRISRHDNRSGGCVDSSRRAKPNGFCQPTPHRQSVLFSSSSDESTCLPHRSRPGLRNLAAGDVRPNTSISASRLAFVALLRPRIR